MKKLFKAVKQAVSEFLADDCMSSGAAIAYYSIFSLPPLLVIVFMLASYAGVSDEQIYKAIEEQVGAPVDDVAEQAKEGTQEGAEDGSEEGAEQTEQAEGTDENDATEDEAAVDGAAAGESRQLQEVTDRAQLGPIKGLGTMSQVIGILVLVFTATGLFAQLQHSLNRAWDVQPDPERGGIKKFLFKRLFSLGMIVVLVFLLLISLVLSAAVDLIIGFIQGATPDAMVRVLGIVMSHLLTFLLATVLFATMFKILPDADMPWRDTFIGGAMTAFLFLVGNALISWYLRQADVGANWGDAATSLIAILAWLYYTSLIVLFGAELTQVWIRYSGNEIQPSDGAIRVSQNGHQQNEHKRKIGSD